MAETFNCGFSRVAVKLSIFQENGKIDYDIESRWKRYLNFFEDPYQKLHDVSFKVFQKRMKVLLDSFNNWKPKGHEKTTYLEHFSKETWTALPAIQKQQHSVSDCKACLVHHQVIQSTFPIKSNKLKSTKHPVTAAKAFLNNLPRARPTKPTMKAIKDTTRKIYDTINKPFKHLFGMDFGQAETKLPELQLQRKQSENQRKEQKRSLQRSDKNSMEQMLANTEADAVLSTRESLSQRGKKRKIQYFEDREEAEQRAKKRKEMEESGERKKQAFT